MPLASAFPTQRALTVGPEALVLRLRELGDSPGDPQPGFTLLADPLRQADANSKSRVT